MKEPDIIEETLPDGKKIKKVRSWKEQFFEVKEIKREISNGSLWIKDEHKDKHAR